MIITIDGPAGTGKSSVAHAVAERLGFDFLDTGAMYRAVGLACLRHGADLNDARELAFFARSVRVEFDWSKRPPGVLLNDEPVGHLLRGSEATQAASCVAQVPAIREKLVAAQQRIGMQRPDLVTEGRDQGTVVFPDARLKFYLDATPQERARRRVAQLRARGEPTNFQEILSQIIARDARDAARAVGPLAVPSDARVIDTTHLTQEQVVDAMVAAAEDLIEGDEATRRAGPGLMKIQGDGGASGDSGICRVVAMDSESSPSPGTPGEGRGEGFSSGGKDPHPNPLPEYRERGQERNETGSSNAPAFSSAHPEPVRGEPVEPVERRGGAE